MATKSETREYIRELDASKNPKLRPQYFYFDTRTQAEGFALGKNKRAKCNYWIATANFANGFTVYNLRRENMGDTCFVCGEEFSNPAFLEAHKSDIRGGCTK